MKLAQISKLVVCVGLALGQSVKADTIQGRLDKMPAPQVTSSKSLQALEWCIGVQFGKWFMPMTLHGERQTFVYMGMDTELGMAIISAALIRDEGDNRTIAFQAPKAWAERTEEIIRSCS